MKKQVLLIFFIFFNYFSYTSFAQETENELMQTSSEKEILEAEEGVNKHAISFILSHTHIQSGVNNSRGDNWIAAPSFGINYTYLINEKWGIGLHTDIITEEFVVMNKNIQIEDGEDEVIERSYPIASAIMLTYKPFKHIAFLAGGGMEFSKEENFSLVRLGVEAPFEIPGDWEIFGSFTYDINIDAYDSINFGIGISKLF